MQGLTKFEAPSSQWRAGEWSDLNESIDCRLYWFALRLLIALRKTSHLVTVIRSTTVNKRRRRRRRRRRQQQMTAYHVQACWASAKFRRLFIHS